METLSYEDAVIKYMEGDSNALSKYFLLEQEKANLREELHNMPLALEAA